jgi:hypothetical protein
MSLKEYRVSYRRQHNSHLQERVFRTRPAADRYVDSVLAETKVERWLPVEEIHVDVRPVGKWQRIWSSDGDDTEGDG